MPRPSPIQYETDANGALVTPRQDRDVPIGDPIQARAIGGGNRQPRRRRMPGEQPMMRPGMKLSRGDSMNALPDETDPFAELAATRGKLRARRIGGPGMIEKQSIG